MGKQAPKGPDYNAVAAKQTEANRPNVQTGNASQTWGVGPDGRPMMKTQLTPMLGYAEEALRNQAYQGLANPLDWGQFGELGNGDAARDQAVTAAYNQATSRLNPQWDQRESQTRTQLANQGLDPNSQAARAQMQQLGQQRNDAYGSAMNSAIAQGQSAGDSVFRNNLMQRQQMVSEALRRRGQPLEELGAMQRFYQMPGYNQTSDILQGAQLQDNSNWRRLLFEMQQNKDIAEGIGQLGSSVPSLFML